MIDMSQNEETIKFRNLINMRYMNDDFNVNYLDGLNVNHLAPEVLENKFSIKADQYNIGALIYEMMTGLLPYFNDDTKDLKNPESIKTRLNTEMILMNYQMRLMKNLEKF